MILPDANLLVAFTWENHQHKPAAENFFQKYPKVATCPLTELALVRVWMQKGASGADAVSFGWPRGHVVFHALQPGG